MDPTSAIRRFHRILLAWDYFEVGERLDDAGGVFERLRDVPTTFSSMQVSMSAVVIIVWPPC